ncbi:MAG TPA: cytochrome P450 [Bryobacteraceae bacterium]|jgi:cytochrome P450
MYTEGRAPETAAPAAALANPQFDLPDRVFEFCRAPHDFVLRAAQTGRIVPFRLSSEIYAATGDPDILHGIFNARPEDFDRGDFPELIDQAFGRNILTMEGAEWASLRNVMTPLFTPNRLAAMRASVQSVIAAHLEKWSSFAQTGEPFELLAATKRLAFDIVRKTFVRIEDDIADDAFEAFNRMDRMEGVRIYMLARRAKGIGSSFRPSAANAGMDRVLYALAERRLESSHDTGDLVSSVISDRLFQEIPAGGRREFLRQLIASIVVAGYVTTADSMFWSIHLLARHPEIQTRLGDETGDDPSPLLRAVINETLRLYPSVWYLGRVARRDVMLGDVEIAAGTKIVCSPWVLHRMPNLWPEPEAFRPERFLPGASVAPRTYIPFGSGMHACLGRGLALLELNGLLTAATRRFRFEWTNNESPTFAATFSLQARERILVRMSSR